MTLPPILTNLPFLKIFKADQAKGLSALAPQASGAGKTDIVDISPAALEKFGEAEQARSTAAETRIQLATTNLPLGAGDDKITAYPQ